MSKISKMCKYKNMYHKFLVPIMKHIYIISLCMKRFMKNIPKFNIHVFIFNRHKILNCL